VGVLVRDEKWSRGYDKRLKRVRVMQDIIFVSIIITIGIIIYEKF